MSVLTYFAYGSNMACAQMDAWCEGHRCLGPARVPDYRLAFLRRSPRWHAGAADIVCHRGQEVWGVLWKLRPPDLDRLDAKESSGPILGYRRVAVRAEPIEGPPVQAIAYAVIQKAPRELSPHADYLALMIAAARERELPAYWIDRLERLKHS